MTSTALAETVYVLLDGDKGVLAMDESNPTCNRRFAPPGIPQTAQSRRRWLAVVTVDAVLPSAACISARAHALARHAALYQEADLASIVEPEVLMTGNHTPKRCADVSAQLLHEVFKQLHVKRVPLEGLMLNSNRVPPGLACAHQVTVNDVADTTVTVLLRSVSAVVPGIAFLSGGQRGEAANVQAAHHALQHRAACNLAACRGECAAELAAGS